MDIHSDAFIMFMYNTDHQRSSSLTFQHFFVVCLASCVCAHLFCIRRNQFPYINSSCLPLVAEHYIVILSYLWCWFLARPGPARPCLQSSPLLLFLQFCSFQCCGLVSVSLKSIFASRSCLGFVTISIKEEVVYKCTNIQFSVQNGQYEDEVVQNSQCEDEEEYRFGKVDQWWIGG